MKWLESRAPPRRADSFVQKAFLNKASESDSLRLWTALYVLRGLRLAEGEHSEIPASPANVISNKWTEILF